MFLYSNLIGALVLCLEATLAFLAFGTLTNKCIPDSGDSINFVQRFPCKVSGLYNQNFLDLPIIGQLCNFYPMMNIATVPILNITLRNNLLEVFPIKKYIKHHKRYKVHDAKNEFKIGDRVRIEGCAPVSRHKQFIAVEKLGVQDVEQYLKTREGE